MGTCKKNILKLILGILLVFIFINTSYGNESFKKLESKKVSYLEFFLLKFENKINKRSYILQKQIFATRVQYSSIGVSVIFDEKKEEIYIKLHAIMDKYRYKKKKYKEKTSDCNQVRNLIFYNRHGYKFLSQKRDTTLSQRIMDDTFKDVFFSNMNFNEKEINFLISKMFVEVTIMNPIEKRELSCYGKVNEYELQ